MTSEKPDPCVALMQDFQEILDLAREIRSKKSDELTLLVRKAIRKAYDIERKMKSAEAERNAALHHLPFKHMRVVSSVTVISKGERGRGQAKSDFVSKLPSFDFYSDRVKTAFSISSLLVNVYDCFLEHEGSERPYTEPNLSFSNNFVDVKKRSYVQSIQMNSIDKAGNSFSIELKITRHSKETQSPKT